MIKSAVSLALVLGAIVLVEGDAVAAPPAKRKVEIRERIKGDDTVGALLVARLREAVRRSEFLEPTSDTT